MSAFTVSVLGNKLIKQFGKTEALRLCDQYEWDKVKAYIISISENNSFFT